MIGENTKFWMHKIEADHSNFISAIEWSVNNENKEKGAVISNALGSFWSRRGQYSTGIRLIEIILESSGILSKSLKGIVLNWIGSFRISMGDNEQAKKYLEESLDLRKEIGDKIGIAESLLSLGNVTNSLGDFELAKNYYEESQDIYKILGSKSGIAATTLSLGNIALNQGDYGLAKKYHEVSLFTFKEIGHKYGIALSINNLGDVSLFQGDYELAKSI
ncbi:MAG: tetratricopeptide repeat protein [Ignavibacteria bacterium]|nr:tetratricopeptide repeat protein [Ignavibacteria bacterium]